MHHKKVLFTAIVAAAALAIAISTIVSSKGSTADSISGHPSSGEPRLADTAGEVAATLPLFHRVDENYVRGSQPLRGGIGALTRLGIKTVVDLRSIYDHTDDVMVSAQTAGLAYEWLPTSVWNPPPMRKRIGSFLS